MPSNHSLINGFKATKMFGHFVSRVVSVILFVLWVIANASVASFVVFHGATVHVIFTWRNLVKVVPSVIISNAVFVVHHIFWKSAVHKKEGKLMLFIRYTSKTYLPIAHKVFASSPVAHSDAIGRPLKPIKVTSLRIVLQAVPDLFFDFARYVSHTVKPILLRGAWQ